MRRFLKLTLTAVATVFTVTGFAQKIKLEEGNLDFLKNEKSLNAEFTYDNIKVGKENEPDYIAKKKDEMNKKEAGTGDKWAKAWVDDRENRYKPKFEEGFNKDNPLQINNQVTAKYLIIYKTTFIEPGFNIGINKKSAAHNAEAIIVDAADKSKVLARFSVEAKSNFWGTDFDTGSRIADSYLEAGRGLAKYIRK
jgi:hypothetical protein